MSAPKRQKTARFVKVTGLFNPKQDIPICICCLSQEGPFATLITCAHADFFATIYASFVMKEDTVVCKLCHNILRKFALFREQTIENITILQQYCQKPYRCPKKKIYNLKKRVTSSINIHSALPNCYKAEEIVNPDKTGVRSSANEATLTREAVLIKEEQLAKEAALTREAVLNKEVKLGNEAALTSEAVLSKEVTLGNEAALTPEAVLNEEAKLAKEAALARESVLALAKETADDNYEEVEFKIESDTVKQEIGLDPLLIPNKTADVDKQLDEMTEPDIEKDVPSYHVIDANKIVVLDLGDDDKEQTEKLAENLDSNTKPSYEVLAEEETYTFVMPKIVKTYGNVKANSSNATPQTVFSVSNSTVESPILKSVPCHNTKNVKSSQNEIVGVPKESVSSLNKIAPKPGLNDIDDDILKISNVVNSKEVRLTEPFKIVSWKLNPPAYSDKIMYIKLTEEEANLEWQKRKENKRYINAPYKCELCVKPFYDKELYKVHKDSKHNPSSWVCKVCQISTSSNAALSSHQREHYFRYKCLVCNELYRGKCVAVRHYKVAHGDIDEILSCNRCDFTTQKVNDMRMHRRSHTKSCPVCKKCYINEIALKLHMENCNKDIRPKEKYICDICKRVCKSSSNLEAHMNKAHKDCSMNNMQNDRPSYYHCAHCKTIFKCKSRLKKHLCSPNNGSRYIIDMY